MKTHFIDKINLDFKPIEIVLCNLILFVSADFKLSNNIITKIRWKSDLIRWKSDLIRTNQ